MQFRVVVNCECTSNSIRCLQYGSKSKPHAAGCKVSGMRNPSAARFTSTSICCLNSLGGGYHRIKPQTTGLSGK